MYANTSLRQRVVTSYTVLIVALGLTVGLWQLPYWVQPDSYYTLGAVLVAAYAMLYLVNRYGLIRVRSRLTTTAMLVLLTLVSDTTHFTAHAFLPLLLILVYASLLSAGKDGRSEVAVFHAFMWLGLLVLMAPLAAVLIPAVYVSLVVSFRSLSVRAFSASLIGLLVPVLVVVAAVTWWPVWGVTYWRVVWLPLLGLPWLDYSGVDVSHVAIYTCVLLTTLPAMLHAVMDTAEHKPQVRAAFATFVIVQIVLLGAAAVLPSASAVWWPLLAVNSSPLLAHHLVLSRHPLTDLWFYIVVLIVAAAFFFDRVWTSLWTFL